MKAPLTFAWANLVWGRGLDDPWCVYRVATDSYAGLTPSAKRDVLGALAGFAFSIGADFQLLRVSKPWSVDAYRSGIADIKDPRFAHETELAAYVDLHVEHLGRRRVAQPAVFVAVALPSDTGRPRDLDGLLRAAQRWAGLGDARAISQRQLSELRASEERVFSCARDYLDCQRATARELQWLIRRAFTRGMADPVEEPAWRPNALIVDATEGEGGAAYRPLRSDVMRLCDAPVHVEARGLRVEVERGDGHQAFLMLGALPEVSVFPGRQSELLFAPLESVPFEVDASVSAR